MGKILYVFLSEINLFLKNLFISKIYLKFILNYFEFILNLFLSSFY